MNDLEAIFQQLLDNGTLIRMIFSDSRKKSLPIAKVVIRPVMLKGVLCYQAEYHSSSKVRHVNLDAAGALDEVRRLLVEDFKQISIFAADADFQILAAKPDRPRIIKKPPSKKSEPLSHDQAKKYIIPDGTPCDFLIRLGVMSESGQVHRKHYAKFRQINRFLEIVEDVASSLPQDREISIVDFGCGKAYLTFALYYYLKLQKGMRVRMTGLDLKDDVIDSCNRIARDLKFEALHFELGDIACYDDHHNVDMVVTLHACDTATDYALIKAVGWKTSIILSVPCCQHELFDQISCSALDPILKHGILKERTSAILTDALRALKLEARGYEVSLIEFTSLEHTAKNIMIRAIRTGRPDPRAEEEFQRQIAFWNVHPTIGNLT